MSPEHLRELVAVILVAAGGVGLAAFALLVLRRISINSSTAVNVM